MAWYDRTMGKSALMAVIFIGIGIGILLAGTAMFAYRRSRGLRPTLSRRQIRDQHIQAVFWLEYLAWISSGVETSHTLQEVTGIRLRGLERQLFEQPAVPQTFWSRLPSCLSHTENSSTSTSNESVNENIPNSYGTPERFDISQSQISTVDGTDSTINKDGGKIVNHDSSSTSPTQSAELLEISTLNGDDCRTAVDDGKIASHDSISFAQSLDHSDKTSESTQHLLAPPPEAHRTTTSYHVESSGIALSHCYISSPFVDPVCPARIKHHHHNSFDSFTSWDRFSVPREKVQPALMNAETRDTIGGKKDFLGEWRQ